MSRSLALAVALALVVPQRHDAPVPSAASAAPRYAAANLTPVWPPKKCPKHKYNCKGACIPDRYLCQVW